MDRDFDGEPQGSYEISEEVQYNTSERGCTSESQETSRGSGSTRPQISEAFCEDVRGTT